MNLDDNNINENRCKVAIVGAGAVGAYYGSRLWEVGHEVQFYTRQTVSTTSSLHISSPDGNLTIPSNQWHVFDKTENMQVADWVVVALKSSSLEAIPDLVVPLLRPDGRTRVLCIMNGLIEDDLVRLMRARTEGISKDSDNAGNEDDNVHRPLQCCQTLYGGMALICSNRLAPNRIDHSYAGLLSAGVAVSSSTPQKEKDAFFALFRSAKIPLTYDDQLLRGRWKKMVWNLPFNGISVAMGGITVDEIVQNPGLRQLADTIMDETVAAANAELRQVYGYENSDNAHVIWEPLGESEKDQMMTLSDNMGAYKTSTMLDLKNKRKMEVKYMFREPVQRADRLGVPVPHLRTIVTMIEAYQKKYGL